MQLLGKFFKRIGDGFQQLGDRLTTPKSEPIRYIPTEPVGEIRTRMNNGKPAYYWLYDDKGKRKSKYLSRDKELAESKREELSGWLLDDMNN